MIFKNWNLLDGLLLRHLFTALALILIFPQIEAAELTPRVPHPKPPQTILGPMDDPHIVIFKLKGDALFEENASSRDKSLAAYLSLQSDQRDSLVRVFHEFSIEESAIKPLFENPTEDASYKDYKERQNQSGRELVNLNFYHQIKVPPGTDSALLCDELNALPFVEIALPALKPAPPPGDVPPPTPDFTPHQFYLNSNKFGVGAVRHLPGADGFDVFVADVEYDWNLDHEDLELPTDSNIDPDDTPHFPIYEDHGTATLGVLGAGNNGYGVTGMSPGASLYIAPAITFEHGYNPARIIDIAARNLAPGDILLIEQQNFVCGLSEYGPIEFYPPVFDAVSAATAAGIVVVMAAGNGGVNLDDPACEGLFDRNIRDSGAIIVGAGAPADLRRLSFSSYGSRVDVQGYGSSIVTTGYGDLFGSGDDDQEYTGNFSGTSSASVIVAGAVTVLQGLLKAAGREPLRSREMRSLLVETGSFPTNSEQETPIGPLPNVSTAAKTLGFEVLNSQTVPLFFSSSTFGLNSFVRIRNLSHKKDGLVHIEAFDKKGNHFGPVSIFLLSKETANFTSRHLEKEIGTKGAGIYRLKLTSLLPFEASAYAHSQDGFYTSMNETVPDLRNSREFHVEIFEPPGKYNSRRNFLYLTNSGSQSARIKIRVQDDFGNPVFEDSVSFSIPPNSSLTLNARQIQQGHRGFPYDEDISVVETAIESEDMAGSFKNPENEDIGRFPVRGSKWQLFISSNISIYVMNLMFDSHSGHLSNLSQ